MWYYLIAYVPTAHGFAPDIPRGTGFLLLAAPGNEAPFGLFEVDRELAPSVHVRPVADTTVAVMRSALRFPPALARAREDVRTDVHGPSVSEAAFEAQYVERLRVHMREQAIRPYVFAEAIRETAGYVQPGQFYWVLRYLRGANVVRWVSSDYFIYEDSVEDFVLSAEQRQRLLLADTVGT